MRLSSDDPLSLTTTSTGILESASTASTQSVRNAPALKLTTMTPSSSPPTAIGTPSRSVMLQAPHDSTSSINARRAAAKLK